ncbi:hypothetical protein GGTG_01052 [Gaeumannomyces tritici R3-111a-1]|uniref:Uncharacterized protein n=1 Tax=Gaeumannomyces tritici (strain R3-111a-1) TaxID=644352 RepID=J3NIH2_GAET3|nr:hypothetical protein GGTG_01052 [Gaeumannomyces tritici R3-111a-1]EJT81065.1 hypothetical protein GGTG_01052 [Gaeumannomyces tritici R3-111a-1]
MSGANGSEPGPATPSTSPNSRKNLAPSGLITKTLTAGAFTGTLGVLVGAAAGVIRARPAGISAILAGVHWFTLGSVYYCSKEGLVSAWGGEGVLTRRDKVTASAFAGGIAGAASGLLARGPRNMLPSALAFSLLGAGGQAIANNMAERAPGPKRDWLASKWSPLTRLTDEEYEKILEERILKLEVEIALAEDRISHLRAAAQNSAAESG